MRRRRATAPRPATPISIIAQVAGSGTPPANWTPSRKLARPQCPRPIRLASIWLLLKEMAELFSPGTLELSSLTPVMLALVRSEKVQPS